MVNRLRVSLIVAGLLLVIAVPATAAGGARHASAELRDVGGELVGWARFTEDSSGILHVNVQVRGLPEGLHGTHIHRVGSCTSELSAFDGAKSHFNPLVHDHGLDSPTGGHAGDLPNLVVNVAGNGHLDATSDRATLSAVSVLDADGSALVIHAGQDDQITNPTGNSGGRIACGVIVAG